MIPGQGTCYQKPGKIHTDPFNLPGHPIVSSTESVTMPIAKYLDKCLTPLIILTRSYIRDTQHFLDTIKNVHCYNDSLLVTWDIARLYTATS